MAPPSLSARVQETPSSAGNLDPPMAADHLCPLAVPPLLPQTSALPSSSPWRAQLSHPWTAPTPSFSIAAASMLPSPLACHPLDILRSHVVVGSRRCCLHPSHSPCSTKCLPVRRPCIATYLLSLHVVHQCATPLFPRRRSSPDVSALCRLAVV
jgi:hypothetical protein